MQQLVMTKGLPGSGKSTWAKEWVAGSMRRVRVNKDLIRAEQNRWSYSREDEAIVHKTAVDLIHGYLEAGYSVVVDNQNLQRSNKRELEAIARQHGVPLVIQSFLDVPVEECVRRNELRTGRDKVEASYIRAQAARFNIPVVTPHHEPYVEDPALPTYAVLCDLDGTLSLFDAKGHRGPYDASLADQDDVNVPVRRALWSMYKNGYKIIYLSARENIYEPQTLKFLTENVCPPGDLFMRAKDDGRKDWIVKGELFEQHIRGVHNVAFVLDDRNQVVEFWRSLGLTVFQVAPGDF